MRTEILRQEMRLGFAETNARIAENNARIAEGSAKTAQAILEINTRLSTIIDAIADLRRECLRHGLVMATEQCLRHGLVMATEHTHN